MSEDNNNGSPIKRATNSRTNKSSLYWYGLNINLLSYLGISPFIWEQKSMQLQYTKNIWQHRRMQILFVLKASQMIYLLHIFKLQSENPDTSLHQFVLTFLVLSAYVIHVTPCAVIFMKGNKIAPFFNRIICNDTLFQGHTVPVCKKVQNHLLLENLILKYFLPVLIISHVGAIICLPIYAPGMHFAGELLFPKPTGFYKVFAHLFILSLETCVNSWAIIPVSVVLLYFLIFCNRIPIWFTYISTVDDLELKIKIFRRLEIFTGRFNDSITSYYLPLSALGCAGMTTGCVFALIKSNSEETSLFLYLAYFENASVCDATSSLGLMGAGGCWFHSEETLAQMKQSPYVTKIMLKVLTSLRPFGVEYGPIRAAKFQHVFDHNDAILNGIISLLALTQ